MHETDVDLAVLDPDKSMVAEMVVDGKMRAEGAPAVFQCALMYTRSDGVRALRIHTVTLPTTPKLPEVPHPSSPFFFCCLCFLLRAFLPPLWSTHCPSFPPPGVPLH